MTALPSSVPPGPTPPSGLYFGWVIVAASTILTLLTVGMRMGIGPFMLPMSQDLGFSRSLLSSIVAIGMLCYGHEVVARLHAIEAACLADGESVDAAQWRRRPGWQRTRDGLARLADSLI